MLEPRPRDFTDGPALSTSEIEKTLLRGRPGTAMQSFETVLTQQQREDVAGYVVAAFGACGRADVRYHTPENGWPDHQTRYRDAVPFATGAQALDTDPRLFTTAQREGLAMFRESCITCHVGRRLQSTAIGLFPPLTSPITEDRADDAAEYNVPTVHDFAPRIDDLSVEQAEGARLWSLACAECHAEDGSGMNWIGKFLQPPPPDFRDPEILSEYTPQRFADATLWPPAGTSMPSFRGVLSEHDVLMIAEYVFRAFPEGRE